ncbi:MAG: exodeoxyribonuclease III, partial [Aeromonas sp.]
MKIVSFNINGLRARLHQLQALIDKHQPDVIGLQEIKVHDEAFPREAVEAMGYHVEFHGQKAHYGVAILSKQAPLSVEKGFPGDDEEAQRRMIMATFQRADGSVIKVMNGYFPQGENQEHETKFPAKTRFYADLQAYLEHHHSPDEQLV